ncbi:hypothetical protein FRB99_006659 [Tulasnella sp. 403]|nr:hypothetical protein FRB99_006659 [Tulasnella sp. 403]
MSTQLQPSNIGTPLAPRSASASPGPPHRILVLGSGNFGSCLADHLATSSDLNADVFLWSRDAATVKCLNEEHKNPKYLTDHVFPECLKAVGPDLPDKELLRSMDMLLFAIPTPGLRKFLVSINPLLNHSKLPLLAFVNKGIEASTRALTLEIIADTLGKRAAKVAAFISGPSFAKEIVKRQPTTVSVVSLSEEHARKVAELFHQPWFRCYPGTDPIGVELAGALKNVYAIAAGVAEGLGYENNTRAGLVTRSLAEMTRIGQAYGASPLTFLTLAGVGDLFLTCSSPTSRNYTVGLRLGRGETLEEILKTLGSVAEGVPTTEGLHEIIQEVGVEAPIAEAMYSLLYQGKTARQCAEELMNLPPAKREIDIVSTISGRAGELIQKLSL